MAVIIHNIRFWGKNALESIGISLAAAVVLLMLSGMRSVVYSEEGFWMVVLSLFPYYLVLAGGFMVAMLVLSYFQTYFSVLLSMNVTRKEIVIGIMSSLALTMAGILVLAWGIWQICPGEIARDGRTLLPLLAAVFFLGAGVSVILGTVTLRWGKVGTIAMIVLCAVMGAFVGVWVSAGHDGSEALIDLMMKLRFKGAFLASVLFYLLSGIFTRVFTRKVEVRV